MNMTFLLHLDGNKCMISHSKVSIGSKLSDNPLLELLPLKGEKWWFLQFSANILKIIIDRKKLSIEEMILMIRSPKSSLCELVVRLIALERRKMTFLLNSADILKTKINNFSRKNDPHVEAYKILMGQSRLMTPCKSSFPLNGEKWHFADFSLFCLKLW